MMKVDEEGSRVGVGGEKLLEGKKGGPIILLFNPL